MIKSNNQRIHAKSGKAMTVAIYKRVSSKQQDTAAQAGDLDTYRKQQEGQGHNVVEYLDKFTGKTMVRPGWERLWADVVAGKIDKVVVWRLDRLGRTVSGLSCLFEELIARKVPLVSIKDSLDLGTAAGRLMAHVLASVAAYETEVRSDRQLAGIAAARKAGKRWGGRKPGTRIKLTQEKEDAARKMAEAGKAIAEIARVLDVTRQTVYRALGQWERQPV
jgi:DNA invertase Pin-like site-specific DNA recombinase